MLNPFPLHPLLPRIDRFVLGLGLDVSRQSGVLFGVFGMLEIVDEFG